MYDKKMNIIDKFLNAIYNFKAYVSFSAEAPGKAFIYLLVLTVVFGALNLVRPMIQYSNFVDTLAVNVDKEVPDFIMKDGLLSVDAKMPIIIGDSSSPIIIDTSKDVDVTIVDDYSNGVFIFEDSMLIKDTTPQIVPYTMFAGNNFSKQDLINAIPFMRVLIPIFIILGIIFFFIGKLITALIIGLIGSIINNSMKLKFTFSTLYSLALYSLTVPIIIKVLLTSVAGVDIPKFWVIYYGIAIVYMYLGMKEIKQVVTPPDDMRIDTL